jgi:hypothetical protein
MIIGISKETKAQENRVSMTPGSVVELTKRGHRVIVETGAYSRTANQALNNVTQPLPLVKHPICYISKVFPYRNPYH